jgi:hypothetical protein
MTLKMHWIKKSLTELTLQIQGWAGISGSNGVPILQELSDHEFDAQAPFISDVREVQRLAAFALEDKPVLTSGNSSTSKRSNRSTDKCPGCGADVHPSSKRQLKRLSARQQRAFCEAHKLKDELKAAKKANRSPPIRKHVVRNVQCELVCWQAQPRMGGCFG